MEILVSGISFIHKVLILRKNKRVGWIVGILASLLSIFYFISIKLFVFAGLEIGLSFLMTYGLLIHKSRRIDDGVKFVVAILCVFLAYVSFTGLLTVFELLASLGSLFGIYLLTHEKDKIGWLAWVFVHILVIYVTLDKNQVFFVVYQVFSLVVACIGYLRASKKANLFSSL